MSDDFTRLNAPTVPGGDAMDESAVTYGTVPFIRKRPRVVITGEGLGESAVVGNSDPAGTEYGLVTRSIHSPYPGTPIVALSDVTLVSPNSETTIATYTVPATTTFYFLGFVGSGDIHGLYKLYVDTDSKLAARSSVAVPTTQINFPYAIFTVAEGQTIRLKITHFALGKQGNFNGTILGYIL